MTIRHPRPAASLALRRVTLLAVALAALPAALAACGSDDTEVNLDAGGSGHDGSIDATTLEDSAVPPEASADVGTSDAGLHDASGDAHADADATAVDAAKDAGEPEGGEDAADAGQDGPSADANEDAADAHDASIKDAGPG